MTNQRQSVGRAAVAATIGNMLEWYDFTIYAAFAVPISKAFFPADSELVSLLLGLVTFGIGFVARPFGAVVLGSFRRPARPPRRAEPDDPVDGARHRHYRAVPRL